MWNTNRLLKICVMQRRLVRWEQTNWELHLNKSNEWTQMFISTEGGILESESLKKILDLYKSFYIYGHVSTSRWQIRVCPCVRKHWSLISQSILNGISFFVSNVTNLHVLQHNGIFFNFHQRIWKKKKYRIVRPKVSGLIKRLAQNKKG